MSVSMCVSCNYLINNRRGKWIFEYCSVNHDFRFSGGRVMNNVGIKKYFFSVFFQIFFEGGGLDFRDGP